MTDHESHEICESLTFRCIKTNQPINVFIRDKFLQHLLDIAEVTWASAQSIHEPFTFMSFGQSGRGY